MLNKYLKKNINTIIILFLYLNPFIDLLTGIFLNFFNINIFVGSIFKTLFLILILYYGIIINKSDKKYLIYGFIYFLIYGIGLLLFKNTNVYFIEISNLIKILYFPLVLIYLMDMKLKIDYKHLVNICIIYMVLIFIPSILGVSLNSYNQGKVGNIGFYNSSNEICGVLSLLMPFLYYLIFNEKAPLIKKIIVILLNIYICFLTGSKITILVLIISILFNLLFKYNIKKIFNIKNILFLLLILGCFIIIVPHTNFYYNIKLHLDFLNINSILDIFSYKFINRFIFSDRLSYLSTNINMYINGNIYNILFGIGNTFNGYIYKLIELDYFDILVMYGIIFLAFIIYAIYKSFNGINFKKVNKKNINVFKVALFSVIFGLVMATLSGHILLSPGVSIYLIILFKILKG